jgi:hypothetical protein
MGRWYSATLLPACVCKSTPLAWRFVPLYCQHTTNSLTRDGGEGEIFLAYTKLWRRPIPVPVRGMGTRFRILLETLLCKFLCPESNTAIWNGNIIQEKQLWTQEYFDDDCLLGCCAVYSGGSSPTFPKCLLPLTARLIHHLDYAGGNYIRNVGKLLPNYIPQGSHLQTRGRENTEPDRQYSVESVCRAVKTLNLTAGDISPLQTLGHIHPFLSTREPQGYKWRQFLRAWQFIKITTKLDQLLQTCST